MRFLFIITYTIYNIQYQPTYIISVTLFVNFSNTLYLFYHLEEKEQNPKIFAIITFCIFLIRNYILILNNESIMEQTEVDN